MPARIFQTQLQSNQYTKSYARNYAVNLQNSTVHWARNEKRNIREKRNQGMYLAENPSSTRVRIRESGTRLLSSLRISESGRLIPEVGTSSSCWCTTESALLPNVRREAGRWGRNFRGTIGHRRIFVTDFTRDAAITAVRPEAVDCCRRGLGF